MNQTGDRLVKVMRFLTDLKVYNYHCRHFLESETKLPDIRISLKKKAWSGGIEKERENGKEINIDRSGREKQIMIQRKRER